MSAMTTAAPSSTSRRASTDPISPAPPVMTTTRSLTLIAIRCPFFNRPPWAYCLIAISFSPLPRGRLPLLSPRIGREEGAGGRSEGEMPLTAQFPLILFSITAVIGLRPPERGTGHGGPALRTLRSSCGPVVQSRHGRADTRPKLDLPAHVVQAALPHRKLRGEIGRMRRHAHMAEAKELAVKIAVTRRDHDPIALAHEAAHLFFVESVRHFYRGHAGAGDFLPGRPELEPERFRARAGSLGDSLMPPGNMLHPFFQVLGQGRFERVHLADGRGVRETIPLQPRFLPVEDREERTAQRLRMRFHRVPGGRADRHQ